jgi:uncharacterized protein (DUF305 family)
MKRIVLSVIAVVASVALTACGNDASTDEGQPSAVEGDHNAADVTFAQDMIPHHRQAIEMSEMVGERASSPEVKSLATRIQEAQKPEIDTMSEWLESWNEEVPSTGGHAAMDGHGMMSQHEMSQLMDAEGRGFDRMFLTMMTKHHQGAIEMARTEQAEGAFGPAKELAGKIITDQQAEIEEMGKLLATLS